MTQHYLTTVNFSVFETGFECWEMSTWPTDGAMPLWCCILHKCIEGIMMLTHFVVSGPCQISVLWILFLFVVSKENKLGAGVSLWQYKHYFSSNSDLIQYPSVAGPICNNYYRGTCLRILFYCLRSADLWQKVKPHSNYPFT